METKEGWIIMAQETPGNPTVMWMNSSLTGKLDLHMVLIFSTKSLWIQRMHVLFWSKMLFFSVKPGNEYAYPSLNRMNKICWWAWLSSYQDVGATPPTEHLHFKFVFVFNFFFFSLGSVTIYLVFLITNFIYYLVENRRNIYFLWERIVLNNIKPFSLCLNFTLNLF